MKHFTVNTNHKWLNIPDNTLGVYNAWDCLATIRLHKALNVEMLERKQLGHYRDVYWPLVAPVMALAKRGLRVDQWALEETKKNIAKELRETEEPLLALVPDINLNAPIQRAKLLYDTLGLVCKRLTSTGARSTDVYALDYALRNLRKKDQDAIPFLHALFHRSRLNTIATRYLKLTPDSYGKVYPDIKLTVETLRFAYADPPIHQIPKEIRNLIRPDPGNAFIALDYSQLEARILAILSADTGSLRAFKQGEDIHRANARDLFDYTEEELNELHPSSLEGTRNYAKTFLFGISYGGRSETLKAKLYCPCERCSTKVPPTLEIPTQRRAELEEAWYRKHQAVLEWRKALVAQVRRSKSYTTRFGYTRKFSAPVNSILPEIYNCPMQSNAAGLMNQRFIRLAKAGLVPAIQMHDENILEAPKAEAAGVAERAKEIMEAPSPELDGYSFPVTVKIGDNWRDLEEIEL